jgi:AcrR family transcriptional regulator
MPRINTEYREDAKKKIIDAAVEVATEEGWGALTLDAVARKVGVTKGAFYSYFANSGTLMQDVIVAMIRRLRDHFLSNLSGEDDIHTVLDNLGNFIFLQPKPFIPIFIQAIAGMPKDPVFLNRISTLFDENAAMIVDALSKYQKNGQIPDEVDLTDAARAIYCMTMGLGLFTHVLKKDARFAKQAWITSVERILMLDRTGNSGKP